MASPNNTDTGNLISDRGPAQPRGFANEGRQGTNSVDDQHPTDKESIAKQDELKNTLPKSPDPKKPAQP